MLVGSAEVKSGHVGAGFDLFVTELDHIVTVGNHLPNRFCWIKTLPALIDISQLDGLTDPETARIRCFLAGYHPKQRCLAGAVGPYDTDDAARR